MIAIHHLAILFALSTGVVSPSTRATLKTADTLRSQFKLEEALQAYEKAYKAQPDEYETSLKVTRAYNDVGENLNDQKKSKEAEKFFRKAFEYVQLLEKKSPDKAEVQFYLAVIHGNLGEFGSASEKLGHGRVVEKHAKRALELDANFQDAYVVLGAFYREISRLSFISKMVFGKVPEATLENSEKLLRKAVKLKPNELYGNYELGNTLERAGKSDESIKQFERVLQLPQSDARQPFIQEQVKKALERLKKNAKSK